MNNSEKSCSCGNNMCLHGCCKVEAVVRVDERGQTVLPKEVREKAKIKAGEKLAVITCGGKKSSCIVLIKADEMNGMVKDMLGPMMKELIKGEKA